MKNSEERIRKLKASLANGALILSIFVVLFPLAMPTVSASPGITIWVDDDFIDDPPNHIWDTIKEGLSDAKNTTDADLVRVYDGTYYEYDLKVEKTLTLEGNGSDTTIIDADNLGTVISISASSVTVTGFT